MVTANSHCFPGLYLSWCFEARRQRNVFFKSCVLRYFHTFI